MRNLNWIFLTALLIANVANAANEGGKGGGGVYRDGQYLTFASAGITLKVTLNPLTIAQLPGLSQLLVITPKLQLSQAESDKLFNSLYPAGSRKYFSISKDQLSSDKRKSLIDAYYDAIHAQIPKKDLVIYAVTSGQETYLLPEFFALTVQRQAIILFQEAQWILGGAQMTEDEAIKAQIIFETFLTHQSDFSEYDADLYQYFEWLFNDPNLAFSAAAKADFRAGRFLPLLNSERKISVKTLLGGEWLLTDSLHLNLNDKAVLKRHVIELIALHPEIVSLNCLLDRVDQLAGFNMFSVGPMPGATSNDTTKFPKAFRDRVQVNPATIASDFGYGTPISFEGGIAPWTIDIGYAVHFELPY